jgi:hypothetical protein
MLQHTVNTRLQFASTTEKRISTLIFVCIQTNSELNYITRRQLISPRPSSRQVSMKRFVRKLQSSKLTHAHVSAFQAQDRFQ